MSETLPPLNSPEQIYRIKSSGYPSREPNPSHLKREVQRLFPRIQQIEKEISSLRMQVPANLRKTILTISQEIQKLQNFDSPNFDSDSTDPDEFDLSSQLADLESRLLLQIEVSIQSSSADLEKKLSKLSEKPNEKMSLISLDMHQASDEHFEQSIESLQKLIEKQQNRNQQRIASIEKSISKLTIIPTNTDSADSLHQLSSDVELHRKQLNDLQETIEMLESNSLSPLAKVSTQIKQNIDSNSDDETETKLNEPDFNAEQILNQIKLDIDDFQSDFVGAINEIKAKGESCSKRMSELEETSRQLTESTKELEQKILDAENMAIALEDQIHSLTKTIINDQNKRQIENLAIQIKSAHENMNIELEALKSRVKKCELSMPLVPNLIKE